MAGCLHLAAVLAPHQAGSEHLAAAEPRHAQLPGHGAAAGGRAAAAAGIQSQETLQQESGPAHHPRRGKQHIVIRDVWVWVVAINSPREIFWAYSFFILLLKKSYVLSLEGLKEGMGPLKD